MDVFKNQFKFYKSQNSSTIPEEALDFQNKNNFSDQIKDLTFGASENRTFFGMKPASMWNVYELLNHPGLLFIENPFTALGERYWCVRCLRDYPNKPSKTNLDIHGLLEEDENWWENCHKQDRQALLCKLRWATLGYHHNWDSKVYSEDSRSPFPEDLSSLCKFLADVMGYLDFKAEAAIINYYPQNSTLSGHTDHSEENLDAPLFSFSFGQSAIFLIGGKTKDVKPTPILLRSGDIIIMTKESRLCYHGVPKILLDESLSFNYPEEIEENLLECLTGFKNIKNECVNEDLWKPYGCYLKKCRINMNIRQVLRTVQSKLQEN